MNLILFQPAEIGHPLPCSDPRARHIVGVLRRQPGETFDAGLVNGPRGKATLVAVDGDALTLSFAWGPPAAAPDPITLIIGLPRPQTARDILRDATTLGVAALHFVATEKSEPGYARSTLWTSGEWERHVLAGATQAFATQIPIVTHGVPLAATLDELPPEATRLALDNYEASSSLSQCTLAAGNPVVLAIGGERGWSAGDRAELRERQFQLVHLGSRVLRTEAAVVVGLGLVRARLGLLG